MDTCGSEVWLEQNNSWRHNSSACHGEQAGQLHEGNQKGAWNTNRWFVSWVSRIQDSLDILQKNFTSIVDQKTRNLRDDTEAMRRDLKAQIAVAEVWTDIRVTVIRGQNHYTETTEIRLRNILGSIPPTVWRRGSPKLLDTKRESCSSFKCVTGTSCWHPSHHGGRGDVRGNRWGTSGPFLRQQLAAEYQSRLKTGVQTSGELLQHFDAAVEQVTHQVLVGLPVAFIKKEASHTFIDGIRDQKVKQHLLMGGDWILNKALNQAFKLEASQTTARLPERVRKWTRAPSRARQTSNGWRK